MLKREVVLETRNLSMHFGGVRAVDNVDFELREKELRCLIGPNGAGKSTFFKCLTGQLIPTSGDVVIRDITMTGREPHDIAGLGVGIKTQVPNLFDGLSAQENLWLSARRWSKRERYPCQATPWTRLSAARTTLRFESCSRHILSR